MVFLYNDPTIERECQKTLSVRKLLLLETLRVIKIFIQARLHRMPKDY